MHKYESYGSWDNCSDFWDNATENTQKEITNDCANKIPSNDCVNKISSNCNLTYDKKSITTYVKYNKYFLNNKFISKKLIINNINIIINNYGRT